MRYVQSGADEFLVVGRNGKLVNKGTAAHAFLWPGSTFVTVPSTRHEACFEMTQESKDGIPLRFKGVVIYRIVDPVLAVLLFDFSTKGAGHEAIRKVIAHVCLGELRDVVSHLTMNECIEQRKTTLSGALAAALAPATTALQLDVVLVAQVFIVDQELRRKLEAELRNALTAKSTLSDIRMKDEIERERSRAAQEAQLREHELETRRIEGAAPVKLLQLEKEREALESALAVRRLANEVRALEVEGEMLAERASQALRKELLPLEQVPAIAAGLTGMWKGANLWIQGGEASNPLSTVAPVVDLLIRRLREEKP